MATRSTRPMEAEGEYIGSTQTLEIGERPSDTEIIDKPVPMDKIKLEAFMNEVLTIHIPESSDENEPPLVDVSVNGRRQFIRRGTEQDVRRKYVEVLARAKRSDYDQVTLDPRDGEGVNRLRHRRALRYPFTVISDPNPIGHAWLRGVLAEAK